MARNLEVNETVYVPWSRAGGDGNEPSAFLKTEVVEKDERSIKVNNPRTNDVSDWISAKFAHRNLGMTIFRIGDFETEQSLLDPLAKSLLQYFRLLLSDDSLVQLVEIRSLTEFRKFWRETCGSSSHYLLIGHGSQESINFGGDAATASDLAEILVGNYGEAKVFMSLGCQTGYAAFGKEFSQISSCSSFIGPYNSVHGGVSSQFAQTFFARHFLAGETQTVAFKNATWSVPGSARFRMWESGTLKFGY